jgi:hypothetical protein
MIADGQVLGERRLFLTVAVEVVGGENTNQ